MKILRRIQLAIKLYPLKKKASFWKKWKTKKKEGKTVEESFNEAMERRLRNVQEYQALADYLEYRVVLHVKKMSFMQDSATEHQRGRLFEVIKILEELNKVRKK